MTIKEKIHRDFMEAYKAKNMKKKDFLGVVRGAIQTQEAKQIESTDENVLKVLKSIEKSINENIEGRNSQGLDISEQNSELGWIKEYQPVQMNEDEIRTIVKEIMNRNSNNSLGILMGLFNKENKGKNFDNKTVNKIIQEELA